MATYVVLGSGNRDQNAALAVLDAVVLMGQPEVEDPTVTINTSQGLMGFSGLAIVDTDAHYSYSFRFSKTERKTILAYSSLNEEVTLQFSGSLDDQLSDTGAFVNGYYITGGNTEPNNITISSNSGWTLIGTLTDLHAFVQISATATDMPSEGQLLLFLVEGS